MYNVKPHTRVPGATETHAHFRKSLILGLSLLFKIPQRSVIALLKYMVTRLHMDQNELLNDSQTDISDFLKINKDKVVETSEVEGRKKKKNTTSIKKSPKPLCIIWISKCHPAPTLTAKEVSDKADMFSLCCECSFSLLHTFLLGQEE